ncbi:hypothetical protein [Streptomyces sp. NPDC047141]|uniref:hypothetical protein n=1 Tax=Streptomyces sp. NPDC047141 TaxID=3155738 RepID=UPI0033DF1122
MDAYLHAPGRTLLPPVITGMVLLVILAILRGVGWLFSSNHQCKGRNNDADYNTPGEAIAAGLAHIGEDVYRWTGLAAVVVFASMCGWATIAFVVGRRG